MLKIYCDVCKGLGVVYFAEYEDGEHMGDDCEECSDCDGKGYNEANIKTPDEIRKRIRDNDDSAGFYTDNRFFKKNYELRWVLGESD